MATAAHSAVVAQLASDQRELLRIATSGSVDDGKSTLIGRLLVDSRQVLDDQLDHVREASERRGDERLDLALLVDGLRAEREQGITIDVAYRYFQTAKRKFILADTPGHEQYTRNMVTGASTADVAILLVDARYGVVDQTRRHAAVTERLGVPHVVVCVNKMDLVDWDEEVWDSVSAQVDAIAERLELPDVVTIPISALEGDNVVERSERSPFYDGPALLEHLERVDVAPLAVHSALRLPVQWVIRPHSGEHHDYRAYAGRIESGAVSPGDEVVVLPAGHRTRVAAVDVSGKEGSEALAGESVSVRLEDDLDISRGDMICSTADRPLIVRELEADVCWMAEAPLRRGARLAIKHTTRWARAIVEDIENRLDTASLEREERPGELALNDIGRISLRTSSPLAVDPYKRSRPTGAFILVDESTNDTVAAGMIRE